MKIRVVKIRDLPRTPQYSGATSCAEAIAAPSADGRVIAASRRVTCYATMGRP